MFKKKIRLIAFFCAVILLLTGCSPIVEEPEATITIYTTFYPLYAISSEIVKDVPNLELYCLVQPQDECLREYSFSDWDLYLLLYSADVVIAGGSGLEDFEETLETLSEDYFSLVEVLYGMTLYEGDGTMGEDGVGGHFYGDNPHIYLSIDGTIEIAENIASSMSLLDSQYAEIYEANLDDFLTELNELKEEIMETVSVCNGQKVVLMNEALIYPAQDYGMEVAGWVERESGEMLYDSSLESCLETLEESGAQIVLIEQQAPKAMIDTLEEEGYIVVKMDILSTHTEDDGFEAYAEALLSNAELAAEACIQANNMEA